MRQEPAEEAGAFACAIRQDARHQTSVVVVKAPTAALGRRKQEHEGGRRPRPLPLPLDRPECNSRRYAADRARRSGLLDPADHHQRFAEISLGMARGVVQRDKHLPPTAQLIAHVILKDGVAAGEPGLVPAAPKSSASSSRARAKSQSDVPPRAHSSRPPVPTGKTDLQIQFHGENPPPSPLDGRAKVAEFYSASSGTIPSLPFSPPFSHIACGRRLTERAAWIAPSAGAIRLRAGIVRQAY
jgi:hypothetical protein